MTKPTKNKEINCCCISYSQGISPCLCNCHSKITQKAEFTKLIEDLEIREGLESSQYEAVERDRDNILKAIKDL